MRKRPNVYIPPAPRTFPRIEPSHGHTLTFWVDASVGAYRKWPHAGLGIVAEEHGAYVMHDSTQAPHSSSNAAEFEAILLAQRMIEKLSPEEQARACVVTDCQPAFCIWWTYDTFRGGAPVFYQPPSRRPRAYELAHELANWARQGSKGDGPKIVRFFPGVQKP